MVDKILCNSSIFNLECYRKFNQDLQNYDDTRLKDHYENIGKYQMRIYHQSACRLS